MCLPQDWDLYKWGAFYVGRCTYCAGWRNWRSLLQLHDCCVSFHPANPKWIISTGHNCRNQIWQMAVMKERNNDVYVYNVHLRIILRKWGWCSKYRQKERKVKIKIFSAYTLPLSTYFQIIFKQQGACFIALKWKIISILSSSLLLCWVICQDYQVSVYKIWQCRSQIFSAVLLCNIWIVYSWPFYQLIFHKFWLVNYKTEYLTGDTSVDIHSPRPTSERTSP